MEFGDIYLVSLNPTAGREQQGKRPVLVVSPDAFNQHTHMPVVLPITSGGNFACTAGFAVSLMSAGTQAMGVARCD
ncbi:type II toxin-antitoxin system PemK/MazF family toxin [Azohydromonas lata]|uniref:type II toxin-antitoxin system PemK/MazF family toxin n=1 Tax=Azohydromonas lata TaxID=45677 RepID=UPI0038990AF2